MMADETWGELFVERFVGADLYNPIVSSRGPASVRVRHGAVVWRSLRHAALWGTYDLRPGVTTVAVVPQSFHSVGPALEIRGTTPRGDADVLRVQWHGGLPASREHEKLDPIAQECLAALAEMQQSEDEKVAVAAAAAATQQQPQRKKRATVWRGLGRTRWKAAAAAGFHFEGAGGNAESAIVLEDDDSKNDEDDKAAGEDHDGGNRISLEEPSAAAPPPPPAAMEWRCKLCGTANAAQEPRCLVCCCSKNE